jgi:hypothetical protein
MRLMIKFTLFPLLTKILPTTTPYLSVPKASQPSLAYNRCFNIYFEQLLYYPVKKTFNAMSDVTLINIFSYIQVITMKNLFALS